MSNESIIKDFLYGRKENTNQNKNLFIDNKDLYSYGFHYKLAQIKELRKNGLRVLLVNDYGYSNTTQKHKSTLLYCNNLDVVELEYCNINNSETQLKQNKETIKTIKNSIPRRRKQHTIDRCYNNIENLKQQNKFLKMFIEEMEENKIIKAI